MSPKVSGPSMDPSLLQDAVKARLSQPYPPGRGGAGKSAQHKYRASLRSFGAKLQQNQGPMSPGFLKAASDMNPAGHVLSKMSAQAALPGKPVSPETADDMSQMDQMKLQSHMNKEAQTFQMMSNIMKNMHDTGKSVINNMR